jgi:hypothetical protein
METPKKTAKDLYRFEIKVKLLSCNLNKNIG